MAYVTETERILAIISGNAPMSLPLIVGEEIGEFTGSAAYRLAVQAERYLRNRSDVQNRNPPAKPGVLHMRAKPYDTSSA